MGQCAIHGNDCYGCISLEDFNKIQKFKEAVKIFNELHIEDCIYHVREHAIGEDDGYEGSSWDHPNVVKFSKLCDLMSEGR